MRTTAPASVATFVPDVSFSSATSSVTESSTQVSVQVDLSEIATADVTIPYTVGGSADASDATVPTGPLVIPIGQSSGTIDIDVLDDALSEGDERIVLTLGAPTNGTLGAQTTHELVVFDDEPAATIAFDLATSSAAESAGTVSVTLTLSDARTEDATVAFSESGTAIAGGVDVTVTPSSPLVIPAGATTASLDVAIVSDAIDEVDEDLVLDLLTPTNCALGATIQHTLTINDDDDPPTVSFSAPTSAAVETDALAAIGVELSVESSFDVTVPVTTSGTATDGVDYTWTPTTVTILAGQTSSAIDVTPSDDADVEGSETATFTLGAPTGATLGAVTSHDLVLVDDDGPPRLVSFRDVSSSAGEASGVASVVVELNDLAPAPVMVPVTASGTATPGVDFDLATTTVTIPVGALTGTADVQILDDTEFDPGEVVDLTLGLPTGADLGSPFQHALTIDDDDGPLTATFALAASSAAEGDGVVLVDVVLNGAAPADVTIPVVLSGTAQAGGVDVDVTPDPLVIGTGANGGQFTVTLTADALYEADETLVLTFGTITGAAPGAVVEHTLTVLNDDPEPVVQFDRFRTVVAESDGSFDVRIELDVPSGLDVTVPFLVTGDASGPSDATLPPSPAVVPAGSTFVDLPVTLVVDNVPEIGEKIVFTLEPPTDAVLGPAKSLVALISDGDASPMATPPPLTPSVTSMTFATTRMGEVSASQALFLTNLHTAPVTLERVELSGKTADFAVDFPVALPITLNPGENAQVDVTFTPMERGPLALELRAFQIGQGIAPVPVTLTGIGFGPTGGEVRMNADDEPFDGPSRDDWSPEYGVTGGTPGSALTSVLGTMTPGLYLDFRSGAAFDYALELPNGTYEVVVHTWEPTHEASGLRVFDVLLEGVVAVDDLDVYDEVGRRYAYVTSPLRVEVLDGILDIGFQGVVSDALVAALEVRSIPLLSTTTTALGFGIVDQGASSTIDVVIQNDGIHTGVIDRLTFRTATLGSSEDFRVEFAGSTYPGGEVTVIHYPNIELPPGTTTIPVTFEPTEHEDHIFLLEFESQATGDMFPIDVSATGGAEAGWGFLHPVPDSRPEFVVDYDADGSELVQLLGAESHTHEPGRSIATFEWFVGGASIATTVDTTHMFPVGASTVELTIGDDNVTPNFATDDRTITVHPVDRVPGPLALYYDGSILGEVFLLDNVPSKYDYAERLQSLSVLANNGHVGASPFTGTVMVQWLAEFDLAAPRTLEFAAAGGVDRRILVDGQPAAGPIALAAGPHDLELRFAVTEIANLPLTLQILEGGAPAPDVEDGLAHDEGGILPVIHTMPTSGTDLGGNRIEIDGFGFFPKDSTVVHWGNIDITSVDFDEWVGERIVVTSPPGTGSVQVTVETPNGISDPVQFDYSPTGPVPLRFTLLDAQAAAIVNATSAAWGPDGKLYVSSLDGSIHIITYDDAYAVQSIDTKVGVSGLVNRDTLAVAFNPFDAYDPLDPTTIKLYVSHGEQFQNGGGAFLGPSDFTGQISTLVGPDFDVPLPLVTGLPVSNHDHSVNGMVFDDNGDMLLCVGGNTNAGVKWELLGDLPESPLSGAIARIRLSDPNFNGTILYEDSVTGALVDDQVFGEQIDVVDGVDVEVYASGFRNSYDIVLHTNGYLYATDNGPNDPYGPASESAATDGGLPHPYTPDTIDLVEPGNYFGSANRSRGRYRPDENVFHSNYAPSVANVHTGPITLVDSSTNGIDEYRSTAFNSEMRGELIAMKWNSGIYRVELSDDGRFVTDTTLYASSNSAFPQNRGLDVVTGPGGAIIALAYAGNRVRVQIPDDIAAVGVTPYDMTPWRAPATGGQPFVIGGVNFGSNLGATSVFVGGVPAVVTSVSDSRIRGILPPSATGMESELLDVVVQVGIYVRTIPEAFRYLPPAPGMKRGTWRSARQLPTGLGDVVTAIVDEHLFVFGDGDTRTFDYDALQDSWSSSLSQRPFSGGGHAAEVVDGKIYLFGGFTAGAAGQVQIYDPVTNQWTIGAPMPWSAGGCATATIGGIVYVGGGVMPGGGTVANFASYDPVQDAWTALGAMPTGVYMSAAGTDGAQMFVFGGRQGTLAALPGIDEVQIYDPVAATWRTTTAGDVGAMSLPRSSTGRAVHWNGEFYVIGGADDVTAFDEVQAYDPITDTWRLERPMPTARQAISPSIFQGRIFVHGGADVVGFGTLQAAEVFSPR